MIYIEIGEVIGNAFISYFEATGKRVLPFWKIEKFAEKIVCELNKNGITAVLYFHKYKTQYFFEEYSEWFTLTDIDEVVSVVMSNNVTLEDLYEKFTGFLNFDIMKKFENPENVKVLFEDN